MYDEKRKNCITLFGFEHLCSVCGEVFVPSYVSEAICDDLAADWGISVLQRRYFNYREGCSCKKCGATIRNINMGKALLEVVNLKFARNFQFVKDFVASQDLQDMKIAEINNCGILHTYLTKCPGLFYSEYGSTDPATPSEDLMALSYEDGFFDVVVTSDVLEHVPNYPKAFEEITRVLKDDGTFVFTVPFLDDRKTVVRAAIDANGQVVHHKSRSYHGDYGEGKNDYLVFYEFGTDFVDELNDYFDVSIYCHSGFGGLIQSVFVCRKFS
nr:class I SAM-dependent methyltransferase [Desulfobulbaceae bacterium]